MLFEPTGSLAENSPKKFLVWPRRRARLRPDSRGLPFDIGDHAIALDCDFINACLRDSLIAQRC